jgi:alanyl-tRNA synthetase
VTERLYYTDPYLAEFDATVVRVERHDGRPAAVLDRTAFYPTSGGQPFDTGRLGGAAVIDVIDRDDGAILHVVQGEIDVTPVNGVLIVHGAIDWPRRFEHMQQHTGQHVLSAAFDRLNGARTESFHLGSASSTIDLNRTVSAADIDRAEEEANRIVWEDRPVAIRFVEPEEAARLPLRKEPARTGRLRIIEVADFDVSACGGTHVARTGAVGGILVRSSERFRAGTRVEFLCGVRALRGFRELRGAVDASVRLVSVLPSELPAGIERLQSDVRDAKRQIKDLEARLVSFEADALAHRADRIGTVHAVIAALEGWDQQGLKTIASAVAARPGHIAALFSMPAPSAVVIARSPDVTADSGALLRKLTERFGGKGGGRADLAQGGGLLGAADDFIAFVRSLL